MFLHLSIYKQINCSLIFLLLLLFFILCGWNERNSQSRNEIGNWWVQDGLADFWMFSISGFLSDFQVKLN